MNLRILVLVLIGAMHGWVGTAQGRADTPDVGEELRILQEMDGEESVRALLTLTETPDATLKNLDELLTIARGSEGTFAAPLNFGMFASPPYWHDFQSKGAVILGRLTDTIRHIDSEEGRRYAVGKVRNITLGALSGETSHIEPSEALESYCYSVFDPLGVVSPAPGTDYQSELLSTLLECASPASEHYVGSTATILLTRAAYALPDRRDEVLEGLRAIGGDLELQNAKNMLERFVRHEGDPISYADYREITGKSDQEILDFILAQRYGGNQRLAHVHTLESRLAYSPDREQLLLRWYSDESLRMRGMVTPSPMSNNAPESDRELFDIIVGFLEREIVGSEGYVGWAVSALRRMIYVSDVVGNASTTTPTNLMEFLPYGRDRVVQVLLSALSVSDPKTREMAASALADIAWMGEDVARLVLGALEARKASFGETPVASSALPGYAIASIDGDIRRASEALRAFEGSGHEPEVFTSYGATVIRPPTLPESYELKSSTATPLVPAGSPAAADGVDLTGDTPPGEGITTQEPTAADGTNTLLVGVAAIALLLVLVKLFVSGRKKE